MKKKKLLILIEGLEWTYSDVVYNAQLKTKEPVKVGFLLEHKSYIQDYPHLQLLVYMLNIWKEGVLQGRNLTFVIPIIVYHGNRSWKHDSFREHFKDVPVELRKYLPDFEYFFTDITGYPDEEIILKGTTPLKNTFLALKHGRDNQF